MQTQLGFADHGLIRQTGRRNVEHWSRERGGVFGYQIF
jgi:hypothetical protein